jgi:hypothetical protein
MRSYQRLMRESEVGGFFIDRMPGLFTLNLYPPLFMKRSSFILTTLLSLCPFVLPAEEAALPEYNAEEIVRLVNLSMALKSKTELNGTLRKGNNVSPLNFRLEEKGEVKQISFTFGAPPQSIVLDLKEKSFLLYDVINGKRTAVADKNYATGIRGTDLTYEDMSFRYLYWPNPIKLESETYSTRKCWKVQCNNPNPGVGAYKTVIIWVDQQSGGLLKMEGYNYQEVNGKPVFTLLKRCKVTAGMKLDDIVNGQKVGEITVLKEMTIESFDPVSGKGLGKTFLEMKKPS